MKSFTNILFTMAVVGLCGNICAANGNDVLKVNITKSDNLIQKYIKSEFIKYQKKMFDCPMKISSTGDSFDIVIGTAESNRLMRNAINSGSIVLPQGKNSDQAYAIKTIEDCVFIAGATDIGVLYGVYEFLEQYGAYFQISGERLPDKTDYHIKQLNISETPSFKYRGVLPWDNFSCGMSGYNLEDYQLLIDRLTRMKFNMLQFHFYPGMAFYTETVNNKTSSPAYIGMPVDVFNTKGSIGSKAFKGIQQFAPKPYIDNIGDPRKQAEAIQEMMRGVIDYAHSRGWKTCVGFELMYAPSFAEAKYTNKPADNSGGANTLNPLEPHNVDINVQRYRSLVNIYPNSDFYWMWQNEAQGFLGRNVGNEDGAAEFRDKYAHWLAEESAFGNNNAAGDLDYAYMFYQVANRLSSDERAKLATGGWSIEHIFLGSDKDFPKEIIFASLNTYDPATAVKTQIQHYKVAQTGRPAWMIDWWEFDGNQWFPQYRASWQEKMYKKCVEFGVESVTLLGWKISGIEHNVRYLSDFAWNPRISAKSFYRDYSSKLYGNSAADLGDDYYMPYDVYDPQSPGASPGDARYMLLGAGWSALALPPLPAKIEGLDEPSWKQIVSLATGDVCGLSGQQKYYDMDQQAIKRFKDKLPDLDEQGRSWAELMINRLEFRSIYLKSMMAINESILVYDKIGREKGIRDAKKAASQYGNDALKYAKMAIEKYASDIRNRNDQGVIAQLNEQYYQIIRRYALMLSSDLTSHAAVDWTTFRIRPMIKFDFEQSNQWIYRDGKINMTNKIEDGRPVLGITIGGDNMRFNSISIYNGSLDLDDAPYMDFMIKTTSSEPFAFMFQLENDSVWYSLNFIGTQTLYQNTDAIPADINDGKWHRVTWDLKKLISDKINPNSKKITQILLGSWENPIIPIEADFKDFSLGKRNMLD